MSSPSIIRKQGCRDSFLEIPFPKIFYITLKIVRSDLILKYSTILVTYFKLNQSATNIAQSVVLSCFITNNNDLPSLRGSRREVLSMNCYTIGIRYYALSTMR